jgi:hypothetical protein
MPQIVHKFATKFSSFYKRLLTIPRVVALNIPTRRRIARSGLAEPVGAQAALFCVCA